VEKVPNVLVNDKKLKDPKNLSNAFGNFFVTIAGKLNIQQIEEEDAIPILKHSFPGNFPSIKIIPITITEIKTKIHSLKQKKNHQVTME
jgi:hypothetical protein